MSDKKNKPNWSLFDPIKNTTKPFDTDESYKIPKLTLPITGVAIKIINKIDNIFDVLEKGNDEFWKKAANDPQYKKVGNIIKGPWADLPKVEKRYIKNLNQTVKKLGVVSGVAGIFLLV